MLEVYDVDKMEFYTDIEIPSYMVNLQLSLSGDGKTVMVIYQYPDDISEVYKKLDSGWEKISGALDTLPTEAFMSIDLSDDGSILVGGFVKIWGNEASGIKVYKYDNSKKIH